MSIFIALHSNMSRNISYNASSNALFTTLFSLLNCVTIFFSSFVLLLFCFFVVSLLFFIRYQFLWVCRIAWVFVRCASRGKMTMKKWEKNEKTPLQKKTSSIQYYRNVCFAVLRVRYETCNGQKRRKKVKLKMKQTEKMNMNMKIKTKKQTRNTPK